MKRSLPWPLAVFLAAAFTTTALADDALAVLRKAQQAMLQAPAMRMTMESVDHTKDKTTNLVVEIVNPDEFHSKTTVNGKVTTEVVSDGKKTLIRQGDGGFHPLPGNTVEMIMNARKSASLESVAEMATDAKVLGQEDVHGTRATVYTFETNAMGLTGLSKVWISDQDNLPLKAERHVAGQSKVSAGPGVKVDRDVTINFEYGPSIKITLPGS
jgi:outer membrane lipoprotein-sorting protein